MNIGIGLIVGGLLVVTVCLFASSARRACGNLREAFAVVGLAAVVAAATYCLSGCSALAGLGKDIQAASTAIARAASEGK